MKKLFYIFLFFILSCGGKKEKQIDLKSFTNQGEKIILVKNKNLNNINVSLINQLGKTKFYSYNNWSQSNQNAYNLINPVKLSINKKSKSKSKNIDKFVIYKDKIISIDYKSKINILDLNLKTKKFKSLYKRKVYKNYNINFQIIAYKDKIFISDNLGFIHCLNIDNLEILWKKNFGVPFKSNIKIYSNDLYLINSNSKIFSINTKNGNLNWSFETASRDLKDNKSYQIAIYNDKLIFTNDNAEIYCLDLKNNNIKWSLIFKTSNFENTPLLFKSSPITIDRNGYIFVSTNHGYTYAIDIVSGIIKWSLPIYSINRFTVSEKYLFNTWNNRFFIINKSNGKLVFNRSLINYSKKNNSTSFKDIIIGKNQIYIFDNNGLKVSLNRSNFNKYTKKKIAKNYDRSIIFNNNLYINTKNSILKY